MKDFSIIRIAASLAGCILLTGCVRVGDPDPAVGEAISFDAGSLLLRDDATRATLLEGGEFAVGQTIDVFGRRHVNEADDIIFNGTEVQKKSALLWDYTPHRYWYWINETDYYDFLGVYPCDKAVVMDIPGNLAVKAFYDITAGDNYDLLMAGYRRSGNAANRLGTVPLGFSHMLSAVRVIVTNDSKDSNFTLDSYAFQHIIVKASAKVTIDALSMPEFSWIDTQRNTTEYRGYTPDVVLYGKNNAGDHSREGAWDFFVPADLSLTSNGSDSEDYMPRLNLSYTSGVVHYTESILLKDVRCNERADGDPIDTWEAGVKYSYHIHIRLDGGVLVSVITTKWDQIDAETPGLLID